MRLALFIISVMLLDEAKHHLASVSCVLILHLLETLGNLTLDGPRLPKLHVELTLLVRQVLLVYAIVFLLLAFKLLGSDETDALRQTGVKVALNYVIVARTCLHLVDDVFIIWLGVVVLLGPRWHHVRLG